VYADYFSYFCAKNVRFALIKIVKEVINTAANSIKPASQTGGKTLNAIFNLLVRLITITTSGSSSGNTSRTSSIVVVAVKISRSVVGISESRIW
jgi:hypothetical protein